MPPTDPAGAGLVAEARRWLGVPFRHQGRTRAGLDCVGLLVVSARALGVAVRDVTGYTRRAEGMGFVSHFRAHLEPVPVAAAAPGEILVFAESACPCHCGILSELRGARHLIHAHAPRRRVIEEPYAGEWPDKVKFAFRLPARERA